MKYKVGDKVKIREDLDIDRMYGAWDFSEDMTQYSGKIATIRHCYDDSYDIDVDDECCSWTDEMFEDVEHIEVNRNITVDIGYHLDYCGHRIIKNIYYGGCCVCDPNHIYCITVDYKNQYILPVDAIDWMIPHED